MTYDDVLHWKRQRLFGPAESPKSFLRGVEFGPLSRPLVPKSASEVYYIDHCSTEDLKAKYEGNEGAHVDKIVDVDIVADGRPLAALVGDKAPLDYVVASHVIEHVPDLAGWLLDMHATLKDGGILYLVVPDKRFTFDAHRRLSSFDEVRAAYYEKRTRPGLRLILDHFANVVDVDTWALWDDYSRVEDAPFAHGPEFLNLAYDQYQQGIYIDVHCWVFTPWSFFELLDRIASEMGLKFRLANFVTTQVHDLEFYVALEKSDQPTDWKGEAEKARETALWPQSTTVRPAELALV